MPQKYKWAVYMGRFQPFHDGHAKVIRKALELAENLVLIIGGAEKARQVKNPWTYDERLSMIGNSLTVEELDHIHPTAIHDFPYSDTMWAHNIRCRVKGFTNGCESVVLVGHHKDVSSYYLSLFPEWSFEDVGNYHNIDATTIRDIYFGHPYINILDSGVPRGTREFMRRFTQGTFSSVYKDLCEEYKYIRSYKTSWDKSPFPPVFVTVDIAVLQHNKLLTIIRGNNPGKGLRALPGGYIDVKEHIAESARRELREETSIDLSYDEFKGRLLQVKVFDHPDRSQIGRVITHLHILNMDGVDTEPVAADDAQAINWVPLKELEGIRKDFSSDHWYMCKEAAAVYQNKYWEVTNR